MTSKTAAVAVLGLAVLAMAPRAHAACGLKTIDIPVRMEAGQPIVSARINGAEARLLLDSGAFYNTVDSRFAAEHKMKPATVEAATGSHFGASATTTVSGAAGEEREVPILKAASFQFAGANFNDIPFIAGTVPGSVSGLIGQNLLSQMDNEYDLKNNTARLVQPQDCKTVDLAYWAGKQGLSYSAMPIDPIIRNRGKTSGIVYVNGKPLKAWFDTGASQTFITARAASMVGVNVSDPGVRAAGGVSGVDRANIRTWVAPFASIKIGDEEIRNTQLRIGQSSEVAFDILIGADFFMAHHVYVANSQGKLYFTYSGGPVFDLHDTGVAPEAADGQNLPHLEQKSPKSAFRP